MIFFSPLSLLPSLSLSLFLSFYFFFLSLTLFLSRSFFLLLPSLFLAFFSNIHNGSRNDYRYTL